jgi:farnesyl-diphosphate farnesyltransferase
MTSHSAHLLTDLLQQVSRSFYTTLRVLPSSVRPQIGLAYLLARATDTIADTELVSVEGRLGALKLLRDRILGQTDVSLDFGELHRQQGEPAEKVLLERIEEAIALLGSFAAADQVLIRAVLDTITSGQRLDLERFGGATVEQIGVLTSDAELDDYTYRVAGCVGEFWTRICRAHVFPRVALDDAALLRDGVRFGKGLQLVNILRDLPKDLRNGRCYLPATRLAALQLRPVDLLEAANESRLRPLYDQYLDLARQHLAAGWEYTNQLPWSCMRIRLACAWPVLIGARTLARLRTENVLDGSRRIKVPRNEVRNLMLRSLVLYPFPGIWRKQFDANLAGASRKNLSHSQTVEGNNSTAHL